MSTNLFTGRFGNQIETFLGALSFTHAINRTLILPPFVEYRKGETKSVQVPFETYFKIEPLRNYTKVITMEYFMEYLSETVWPKDQRVSFCYSERKKLDGTSTNDCNAKDGNPFFSFWDGFRIDFVASEFFGPILNFDVVHREMDQLWNKKYKPKDWPLLAFTGAPGSFPVQAENVHLQKYLQWSDDIDAKANKYIKNLLPKGAFIGVHLRNGIDWIRACEHIKDVKQLFSSAQCLGYNNEKGSLTIDICLPSQDIVIRQIKRIIKRVRETQKTNEIKSIFVASDNNHMIDFMNDQLKRMKVKAFKLPVNSPHIDLAILGRANFFVGNCVSSYTAFVKRERDSKGFPSQFFGYPTEKIQKNNRHEEL